MNRIPENYHFARFSGKICICICLLFLLSFSLGKKGSADAVKYSKTIFTIDKVYDHYTLLNCKLTTGRTHQIRAHLKHVNHPIVGDALYGGVEKSLKTQGQLLFAYKLHFVHPTTKKLMGFEVDLPNYFKQDPYV